VSAYQRVCNHERVVRNVGDGGLNALIPVEYTRTARPAGGMSRDTSAACHRRAHDVDHVVGVKTRCRDWSASLVAGSFEGATFDAAVQDTPPTNVVVDEQRTFRQRRAPQELPIRAFEWNCATDDVLRLDVEVGRGTLRALSSLARA